MAFRRTPESSIFKTFIISWTPAGVYPAGGETGVTTFYEFIKKVRDKFSDDRTVEI